MKEKSTTMKSAPVSERPYEKCLQNGPGVLSDAELLAVILRTGTSGHTALDAAREILQLCPYREGLPGILHLTVPELRRISGIGSVKAIQILCIGELLRRLSRQEAEKVMSFQSPASVAEYYMEELRHCEQETVRCMMLDVRNHLIAEKEIYRGTVNVSVLSPREIFLTAMSFHAVSILLVHNHPSGDPTPSDEDIEVTKQMIQAGEMLGIRLRDHIIIGDNRFVSLLGDAEEFLQE